MSVPGEARELIRILARVAAARLRLGPDTHGTTCAVLDDRGRLLLVKTRYHRGWSPCGGFLDPGEDPVMGMRRELTEEVGLPADAPDPVHCMDVNRPHHQDHAFALQLDQHQAAALHVASWELSALGWFTPRDLPRMANIESTVVAERVGLLRADQGRWVWGARVPSTRAAAD